MRTIDTARYGAAVNDLLALAAQDGRPKPLVFGAAREDLRPKLAALGDGDLAAGGAKPRDAQAAACLRAGMWLLFDFEKESHDICQAIPTPSGSYWHEIIHRREPDAGNARYWNSRVGDHPVHGELIGDARALAGDAPPPGVKTLVTPATWDPDEYVKLCTSEPDAASAAALLAIQAREWALLFDYDFTQAFGA